LIIIIPCIVNKIGMAFEDCLLMTGTYYQCMVNTQVLGCCPCDGCNFTDNTCNCSTSLAWYLWLIIVIVTLGALTGAAYLIYLKCKKKNAPGGKLIEVPASSQDGNQYKKLQDGQKRSQTSPKRSQTPPKRSQTPPKRPAATPPLAQ
jgi:hypothetical protein